MARIAFHPAVVPLRTLSPDNDTVQAGRYLATTLSAVDEHLATGNIKDGITIFGFVGTVVEGTDISDADAAVEEVKDGKLFYSVEEPRKEGTMPTETLAPGSSAYPAGYHEGNVGGLVAIDEHLVAGEIKKDTVIFGVTGTHEQTIGTTKLNSTNSSNTTSVSQAWKAMTFLQGEVPSSAKWVEAYASARNWPEAGNGDVRITYNGVEKVTAGFGDTYHKNCMWNGEGLGIAADLKGEVKIDSGTQTVNCSGVFWYQTLT